MDFLILASTALFAFALYKNYLNLREHTRLLYETALDIWKNLAAKIRDMFLPKSWFAQSVNIATQTDESFIRNYNHQPQPGDKARSVMNATEAEEHEHEGKRRVRRRKKKENKHS